MRDKGAAVTDEQVPQVVEYLVRTAGNFTITCTAPDGAAKGGGKANGKGGGKSGGFAAKNLKVLTAATLPESMQGFVQGLGLLEKGTCSYCHVEDRSSDEKIQKVIARSMITITREINMASGMGNSTRLATPATKAAPPLKP